MIKELIKLKEINITDIGEETYISNEDYCLLKEILLEENIYNDIVYLCIVYEYNNTNEDICNIYRYISDEIIDTDKLIDIDKYRDKGLYLFEINIKDKKTKLIKNKYYRYNEELKDEYKGYKIDLDISWSGTGRWQVSIYIYYSLKKRFYITNEEIYLRYKSGIYEHDIFCQMFFEEELKEAIEKYEQSIE